MAAPRASRPDMRSYGVPPDEDGMLPWSWAEQRFAASHNYWVATVRPDGRPSVTAVWGLWLDGKFWFSCGAASRKAKNLASNPRCTITSERADEAVILEGTASPVKGRDALAEFVAAYKTKYDWDMDPENDGYFVVTPSVVFGFIETTGEFAKTATRWTFD